MCDTTQVNDRSISSTSYSKVQPKGSRTEGEGIGMERAGHEDEGRNAAVGVGVVAQSLGSE